jgi:hypothetical protein
MFAALIIRCITTCGLRRICNLLIYAHFFRFRICFYLRKRALSSGERNYLQSTPTFETTSFMLIENDDATRVFHVLTKCSIDRSSASSSERESETWKLMVIVSYIYGESRGIYDEKFTSISTAMIVNCSVFIINSSKIHTEHRLKRLEDNEVIDGRR